MCWLEDNTSRGPEGPTAGPSLLSWEGPQAPFSALPGKGQDQGCLGSELCFLTLTLRCDPSLWVLLIMRTAGPAPLRHTPDFTQFPG